MTEPILQTRAAVHVLASSGWLYASESHTANEVRAAAALLPFGLQWVSTWALQGQATGHEWCECDSCGIVRLQKPPTPKGQPSPCMMTVDCPGHMVRIMPRPRLTNKIKRALGMEVSSENRRKKAD